MKNDKKMSENKIDAFTSALLCSGYEIKKLTQEGLFYEILVKKNAEIKIKFIIKNIVKSGWSDKPLIRRIQIPKITEKSFLISNFKQTTMLVGFIRVIDKNIFVLWSIYKNNSHKTNKSCYINLQTIFRTYLEGYVSCMESDQMIWAADENNLSKALYNYLSYNNTTIGE